MQSPRTCQAPMHQLRPTPLPPLHLFAVGCDHEPSLLDARWQVVGRVDGLPSKFVVAGAAARQGKPGTAALVAAAAAATCKRNAKQLCGLKAVPSPAAALRPAAPGPLRPQAAHLCHCCIKLSMSAGAGLARRREDRPVGSRPSAAAAALAAMGANARRCCRRAAAVRLLVGLRRAPLETACRDAIPPPLRALHTGWALREKLAGSRSVVSSRASVRQQGWRCCWWHAARRAAAAPRRKQPRVPPVRSGEANPT